jgi:hypothetical protein
MSACARGGSSPCLAARGARWGRRLGAVRIARALRAPRVDSSTVRGVVAAACHCGASRRDPREAMLARVVHAARRRARTARYALRYPRCPRDPTQRCGVSQRAAMCTRNRQGRVSQQLYWQVCARGCMRADSCPASPVRTVALPRALFPRGTLRRDAGDADQRASRRHSGRCVVSPAALASRADRALSRGATARRRAAIGRDRGWLRGGASAPARHLAGAPRSCEPGSHDARLDFTHARRV